ncbi:DUF389 domain-containing protein [Streptomyces sp. SudanB148_2056]|uniref:DUF389 domain-containing protein n=1 Tax=Streptomyces sp. SudanB148_2056 TaxID=3035280 RepID=UPI003F576B87
MRQLAEARGAAACRACRRIRPPAGLAGSAHLPVRRDFPCPGALGDAPTSLRSCDSGSPRCAPACPCRPRSTTASSRSRPAGSPRSRRAAHQARNLRAVVEQLQAEQGSAAPGQRPGSGAIIAALATGFAGAVALARRDVAAVLPGVAIAISLVPPLVVAGVCLGQLSGWLALGALVLFVSNLFALVFGGMVVFASLGYGTEADKAAGRPARRTYAAMILLFTAVFVPLTANTVITLLLDTWTGRTKDAAQQWLADVPDASVTSVDATSRTMYVHVRSPGDLPPVESLLDRLEGRIPDGIPVAVDTSRGRRIDAGVVGG